MPVRPVFSWGGVGEAGMDRARNLPQQPLFACLGKMVLALGGHFGLGRGRQQAKRTSFEGSNITPNPTVPLSAHPIKHTLGRIETAASGHANLNLPRLLLPRIEKPRVALIELMAGTKRSQLHGWAILVCPDRSPHHSAQ